MGRLKSSIAAAFVAALVASAAAGQEINPLTQIRPGKTKAADIEAMLGSPVERDGTKRTRWEPNKSGVKELVAWFGDDGTLKWARLALVNELPPAAVALLFDLAGEPIVTRGNAFSDAGTTASLTEHYAGGVHLVVADGKVRYVWLTGADERPADVAKAATLPESAAATARPAAVEGTGTADATVTPGTIPATDAGGIDRSDFADPDTSMRTVPVPYSSRRNGCATGRGDRCHRPRPPYRSRRKAPWRVRRQRQSPAHCRDSSTSTMSGTARRRIRRRGGVDVFARVNAVGLKDRTVTMKLTLRAPGSAAGATAGAGLSITDKVAYDTSTWEQARIAVPAKDLATGQPVVLHWQAECDGLTSYAEADCATAALAGAGASSAPIAARAITMTNVRVEHGAVIGEFPGMWAYADIGAVGLTGKALTGEVRFRVAGGAAVRPPANVQGVSGPDGAVALSQQDTAASDNTTWTPFRIFVPYIAFGLPSGTHRIIMTFKASCEGLAAASRAGDRHKRAVMTAGRHDGDLVVPALHFGEASEDGDHGATQPDGRTRDRERLHHASGRGVGAAGAVCGGAGLGRETRGAKAARVHRRGCKDPRGGA